MDLSSHMACLSTTQTVYGSLIVDFTRSSNLIARERFYSPWVLRVGRTLTVQPKRTRTIPTRASCLCYACLPTRPATASFPFPTPMNSKTQLLKQLVWRVLRWQLQIQQACRCLSGPCRRDHLRRRWLRQLARRGVQSGRSLPANVRWRIWHWPTANQLCSQLCLCRGAWGNFLRWCLVKRLRCFPSSMQGKLVVCDRNNSRFHVYDAKSTEHLETWDHAA